MDAHPLTTVHLAGFARQLEEERSSATIEKYARDVAQFIA